MTSGAPSSRVVPASVEKTAASGVAWNLATGVGTRVLGLLATLLLTRFIAPAEYGELSAAATCVQAASLLTGFGVGPYIIANKSPARVVFQVAVLHVGLGIVPLVSVFFLRGPLGIWLEAPGMGRFVAGYAIVVLLDRARQVPSTLLVRELRFRAAALVNSAGEITFACVAVSLAPWWGGYAVVGGSIARSVITFILSVAAAPRAQWLKPSRFEKETVRHLFGYGTPLMLSNMADRAACTWDNLIILRLFGANVLGAYALAYSLAETPLVYVAERMGDVLMPAFSKMEPAERPAGVVRAAGLMALVVAPLGVGLGAVAPTIVRVFFDARWAAMAPMLTVLSVITVFQPAPWAARAYLGAEMTTRPTMVASIVRAILVLSLVAILGWVGGPVWACAGAGVGYAAHSVLLVFFATRVTPLQARPYLVNVLRPLFACVPMFLSVAALRIFFAELHTPGTLSLTVEIVCGAGVYVGAALVVARANVRELISLMRAAP